MAKEAQESKSGRRIDTSSKTRKTFLVVLTACLIFAGPTYIAYIAVDVAKIDYTVSMLLGIVLFAAGFVLLWRLIKSKAIS